MVNGRKLTLADSAAGHHPFCTVVVHGVVFRAPRPGTHCHLVPFTATLQVPPRWQSTGRTLKRTPPWNAGSSRYWQRWLARAWGASEVGSQRGAQHLHTKLDAAYDLIKVGVGNFQQKHLTETCCVQVLVGEPSVPDTISILRGLKERYSFCSPCSA